ncbi:redoxin domain-containing protein [Cytophagaceae bacterium ABcell3]|nr:redoxin domain-containing protein [Cytophagaceae bacterium ABcell3]
MKKLLNFVFVLVFLIAFVGHELLAQKTGNILSLQGRFQDLSGNVVCLDEHVKGQTSVFIFFNPDCSISHELDAINESVESFGEDVQFYGVVSGGTHRSSEIKAYVEKHDLGFPVILDKHVRLSAMLSTEVGPTVFIVDQNKVLRYKGAITSRSGIGEMGTSYLELALEAVASGKDMSLIKTEVADCLLFPWSFLEGGAVFREVL